jgi:hypothetical protein
MIRGGADVSRSSEPAIVRVEVGPDFRLAFESVSDVFGDAESRPVALMALNDSHVRIALGMGEVIGGRCTPQNP